MGTRLGYSSIYTISECIVYLTHPPPYKLYMERGKANRKMWNPISWWSLSSYSRQLLTNHPSSMVYCHTFQVKKWQDPKCITVLYIALLGTSKAFPMRHSNVAPFECCRLLWPWPCGQKYILDGLLSEVFRSLCYNLICGHPLLNMVFGMF